MSGLMASQGLLQISQAINHLRICIRELSILQAAVADTRLTYACKGWSYQAAMLTGKSLVWRERGGAGGSKPTWGTYHQHKWQWNGTCSTDCTALW